MKKQLAMKWAKALRSKKFKQTTGTLHRTEDDTYTKGPVGYCCLGVLATICGVDEDIVNQKACLDGEHFAVCDVKNVEGAPNAGVVKVRKGNTVREYVNLAEANDDGVSFRSIASWIEKNYSKL